MGFDSIMKRIAKFAGTTMLGGRECGIYKVSPPVQYTGMGGGKYETDYVLMSTLDEGWIKETVAYACNSRGKILDVDMDELWIATGIVGDEEAMETKGWKLE